MSSAACFNRAQELTDAKMVGHAENEPVSCRCKTGKIIVTVSTFGSSKPPSRFEMDCMECAGTGALSMKRIRSSFLNSFVHCKCAERRHSSYSEDGREIFGNDTYLCDGCGMVTQFG